MRSIVVWLMGYSLKLRNLISTPIFIILDLSIFLSGESEAVKKENCIGNYGFYNIIIV